MKLPRVRQFCCFDLCVGSLVIACSELAYAVLGIVYSSRLASFALSESANAAKAGPSTSEKHVSFGFADGIASRKFGKMYFWFHAAELIGVLLISALLIHGIRTKHRSFFIPWLGGHFLTTAVFGIFAIVMTLGSFAEFGTAVAETGFAAAAVCLLAFMINGYITVVVYSYYKQIGEEARAQRLFAPLEVEVHVPYPEQLPPAYEEVMRNKEAYALMNGQNTA